MSEEGKIDNLTMRIWLQTLDSTVGPGGLKSILHYAHLGKYIDNLPQHNDDLDIPVADIHILVLNLVELFGQKGARALQLHAGHEFFRIGMMETGPIVKALQMTARILPEAKRMKLVLDKLAEESEKRYPTPHKPRIEVVEEKEFFLYSDKGNLESQGVISETPVCGVAAGLLSALVEWITGNPHKVEEIQCRAMGDPADVFRIWKAHRDDT
jgi:predicted hydrocarbon binding protein